MASGYRTGQCDPTGSDGSCLIYTLQSSGGVCLGDNKGWQWIENAIEITKVDPEKPLSAVDAGTVSSALLSV